MAKQQVSSIDNSKSAVYQVNGLAYASNISTVNKRDDAGNLIYQEGEANPLLVIEPVAENIYTNSVIKVVNTQFSYFKFPATTTVESDDSFDLGIDPNDFIINLEELGDISAPELPTKYQPTVDQEITKTASSVDFVSLEFSKLVEGQSQTEPNKFTITQAVIDAVAQAPKQVLRVEGLFKTFYSANLDSELEFVMKLLRDGTEYEYINSLSSPSEGPQIDSKGNVSKEGVYTTKMDFTVKLSDLEASLGDLVYVQARTDRQSDKRYHVLKALDSYITFTAE